MGKWWIWLAVIGLVVLFVASFIGLYILGGDDQSPLERTRDISIVFLTGSMVLVVLLMGAMLGAVVWLVLLLKDKIIPLLEQLTMTAHRVRGTSEFVSEEVARPIISVYSSFAGIRAMIKTVTGRDRRK